MITEKIEQIRADAQEIFNLPDVDGPGYTFDSDRWDAAVEDALYLAGFFSGKTFERLFWTLKKEYPNI